MSKENNSTEGAQSNKTLTASDGGEEAATAKNRARQELGALRKEAKRLGQKENFNAQEVLAAASALALHGELDAHVFESDTALTLACKFNEENLIKELLAIGANPSAPTRHRQSPLMELIGGAQPMRGWSGGEASRWRACAEALAAAGADIHHKNEIGQQAIHWAAWLGSNVEPLAWLLEKGADPSAGPNNGEAPLLHAAKVGNLAMLKILIGAGADLFSECWTGGPEGQMVDPVGMAKHWRAIQSDGEAVVDLLSGAQRAAQEKSALEAGIPTKRAMAKPRRV